MIRLVREQTDKNGLVASYGDWIGSYKWDLFLTVTFGVMGAAIHKKPGASYYWDRKLRNIPPEQRAKQAFNYFLKHRNSPTGIIYYKGRIRCFTVFERLPHPHIHAFVKGIREHWAEELEYECSQFFGDSKVNAYDPTRGAKYYLGDKCIEKDRPQLKAGKEGRFSISWDVPYTINSRYVGGNSCLVPPLDDPGPKFDRGQAGLRKEVNDDD